MINPFFKNKGPFKLDKLIKVIDIRNIKFYKIKFLDIKDLATATKMILLFFIQKNMNHLASKTKASFVYTLKILLQFYLKL